MPKTPPLHDLRLALQLSQVAADHLTTAQALQSGENIEGCLRRLHAHMEGLRYQIQVAELKAKPKPPPAPPV